MAPPRSVAELITLHEKRVPAAYQDSLGYWTIGVGHLIDARKGGRLPDHIIDALREWDIAEATRELREDQPWTAQLDEVRHAALIDMVFNLGPEPFDHDGVKDWPMFLGQMQRGEWKAASDNMLSTKWAAQVGSRATRLSQMIRTGTWPDR